MVEGMPVGAGVGGGLVGDGEDGGLVVVGVGVGPEEEDPGDQSDDAGGGQVCISVRTEESHPLLTK